MTANPILQPPASARRGTLPARLATLLGFAAFGSPSEAQNLLVNPSFESGAHVNQGGGFMLLSNPATTITGWTVSFDEIAWGTVPNSDVIAPLDGSSFLDLQGPALHGTLGAISQTITTNSGQRYRLSFHLGTQQAIANDRGPISVVATAGSTSVPFTYNPGGTAGTRWGQFGFDFTAAGSSTVITITGTATAGCAYIGLDLVSVAALPETNHVPNGSFEDPVLASGEARIFATGATTVLRFYNGQTTNRYTGLDSVSVSLAPDPDNVSHSLVPGVGTEGGQAVINMTATAFQGLTYDLESSRGLLNWTPLQTITAGSGGTVTCRATESAALPRSFYRSRRQ